MSDTDLLARTGNYSEAEAGSFLLRKGLKRTNSRLAILRVLATHPDRALRVEQIYKELWDGQKANLGTVYRTLGEFERLGIVERQRADSDIHGKALYFLKSVAPSPRHLRVTCRRCGRNSYLEDERLGRMLHGLAQSHGFEQQLSSMALEVTCNECAQYQELM